MIISMRHTLSSALQLSHSFLCKTKLHLIDFLKLDRILPWRNHIPPPSSIVAQFQSHFSPKRNWISTFISVSPVARFRPKKSRSILARSVEHLLYLRNSRPLLATHNRTQTFLLQDAWSPRSRSRRHRIAFRIKRTNNSKIGFSG